jgi:parallel beta-helix repeat protein
VPLAVGALGLSAAGASAATLTVCDGCTYETITAAVAAANANDTIDVDPGTYNENVTLNKAGLTLQATDPATPTVIVGQIGGGNATVRIAASDVTVEGFIITRAGNDPADWDDPTLTSSGVAIQGQAISNALIQNSLITGMRTAIDVNNSNGHTIRDSAITNNRTGLIFRNQTDNLTVVNNAITGNWTVGVLFLDAGGVPPQQALNSHFNDNDISGNWYGQVVDRQPGAGANVKDFSGNWFGTDNPVVTTADSAEPGYSAQIPVAFGGGATPPGNQPDIAGPGSANIDDTPFLWTGSNSASGIGFEGDFSEVGVTAGGAQSSATGRIQEAVNLVATGATIHILAGTYPDGADIDRAGVSILGAQAGQDARSRSGDESIVKGRLTIAADDLTFDGLTFRDIPSAAVGGSGHQGTQLLNNVFQDNVFGAQYDNNGSHPSLVRHNLFITNNNPAIPGSGTGIFMQGAGSQNVTITENEFHGHVNAATNVGVGTNITFSDNTAIGESTLLVLQNSQSVTVRGNSATGTTGSGIYLANGNDGVEISGNDLDSAGGASAIRVSDAFGAGANQNVTIAGNTIRGAWTYAINANAGILDGHLVARQNRFGAGINNADGDPANSIDAAGNWWGCNGGPGAAGCASNSDGVTAPSWLQLQLTANPTLIATGTGTSALTASLADTGGSGSGAVASLFPATSIGFGTTLGSMPSSAQTSAGAASANLSAGPQAGTADVTATLDSATRHASVTLHYFAPSPSPSPSPSPEPEPTPPTPPSPVTPVTQAPSQNPTNENQGAPKPTPREVEQTTEDARSSLGVPVKHDRAFDLGGDALAYVPRRRSDETPAVRGSTATFRRDAIREGAKQELLAVGCPALDCTVDFTVTITYRDPKGKLRTIELPGASLDVSAGTAAVLSLELPRSVRQALLKGNNVKLTIGTTVSGKDGNQLGSDSRTLRLKTPQPKHHRHHRR